MLLRALLLLLGCALTLGQLRAAPQAEPSAITKYEIVPQELSKPALKYRLVPELKEMTTGNAAQLYYRAFSPDWQFRHRPEVAKPLKDWLENQKGAPPEALRILANSAAMKEIDRAARRTHCEWEMLERLREDGVKYLLPDVQGFREYAQHIKVRIRFAVLDKKYDEAVYALQTGFSLGRHVGDAPTLIQALVGLAIVNIMLQETEQALQQPGMPNLYWPLTDLPKPLIDLRKCYQGEKLLLEAQFPLIREMETQVLTADRLAKMQTKELPELMGLAGLGAELPRIAEILVLFAKEDAFSRKYLLEQGKPKKFVEEIPVAQAVFLANVHLYYEMFDELRKWQGVSHREAILAGEKLQAELKDKDRPGMIFAKMLIPATNKVHLACLRTERRVAWLRTIEALRYYTAKHEGKLPAKLSDIDLPTPLDPITGKEFLYRVVEGKAELKTDFVPELKLNPTENWHYEISVKKAK